MFSVGKEALEAEGCLLRLVRWGGFGVPVLDVEADCSLRWDLPTSFLFTCLRIILNNPRLWILFLLLHLLLTPFTPLTPFTSLTTFLLFRRLPQLLLLRLNLILLDLLSCLNDVFLRRHYLERIVDELVLVGELFLETFWHF